MPAIKPLQKQGCWSAFTLASHTYFLIAYLLIIIGGLTSTSTAFADIDDDYENEPILSDDNVLIVDIFLGRYKLAENVFIYSSPEATVIPLQTFFDSIQFPIEVDPAAGKAIGWFISEDNRFELNATEHSVFINNQKKIISDNAIILNDDIDLYVDIQLLKQWFPIQVELDPGQLRLVITGDQPLPLENELEREKSRKRALSNKAVEQLPEIPDHYDWVGEPMVYINMGYQIQRQDNQNTDNVENDNYSAIQSNGGNDQYYTVQANGDLLGMEGRFSMTEAPNSNYREEIFTLYKRPLAQNESLVAGLEYMALGDVYAVSDSLIFNGGDGLGVDLQFGQATNGSGFGKKIIEGEGPPGWEVELYRNGALLDFQRVGTDGRYRFSDVPVEFGDNIFDVRLFGPQGQSRSSRENINVGNEMLAKGQTTGRLSFTNLGESVFDEKQYDRVGESILDAKQDNRVDELGNIIEFQERIDDKKSYAQIKHGVTDSLAVAVGAAEHDNVLGLGNNNQYSELGLIGALPGVSLELNQVMQANAGHAELISGQTRIGSAGISFIHKSYTDFTSDRNIDGILDSESEARISGQLDPFYITPISYYLTYNNEQLLTGSEINTWDSLAGFQAFNGRVNIDTTYTEFDNNDNTVVGQTSYSRVVGSNISIRADINYRVKPEFEAILASTDLTWFPANNIRGQLGIHKDLTEFGTDSLDITASYLMEEVTFSASAFITEDGDNALFLTAEFCFGYEGNNRWSVTGQSRGQNGRVKAKVFHDLDLDGIYSAGDKPLEGVEFLGRSRWKGKETDQEGLLYLDGLSVDSDSVIAVNESSLGDPYLKPLFNKSTITSHAGGINRIDIAVVSTVEAEGSLSIQRKGKAVPLPGIPINVKNADGKIIATTITEFDGFFIFSGLAPGKYWLTIDSEALTRYNIDQIKEIPFHAKASDGITYLDKIVLKNSTSSLSDNSN